MKCKDIIELLQQLAPESLACSWDHVGLQLGRMDKNVSKILIALELNEEIVNFAVSSQVDMLLTHHPLIFTPLNKITSEDYEGRMILQILRNDISYYAMHTNFDMAKEGMGALCADLLGLREQRNLAEKQTRRNAKGEAEETGLGRIGHLVEPVSLSQLIERLKREFGEEPFRVYLPENQTERLITEIAVVPGAGSDYIDAAIEAGAEVYVTGDVSHHRGLDAKSQGLILIDAGHYRLEYPFVEYMENWLNERISADIELLTVPYHMPYQELS